MDQTKDITMLLDETEYTDNLLDIATSIHGNIELLIKKQEDRHREV